MTDEKDDVHWITGQELREIYADNLSLDKYDEIRKRSVPAYEAMLAESLTEEQTRTLLMWLVRNRKELFSQIVCPNCKEDVAEKAAVEARKDEREKVLKEIMDYVRKSKYFGKHFMLIMCESLQNPATPAVKEQKS